MDRKSNFIKDVTRFLASCDEEFIIHFANKGLYKRAKKELDKGIDIAVEIQKEKILCSYDDIVCEVGKDQNDFRCSCPARGYCKHYITCLIYLRENMDSIFSMDYKIDKVHKEEKRDFSWVLDLDIKTLIKKEGLLDDIVRRHNWGVNVVIKEDHFLTLDFKDFNRVIRFSDRGDIKNTLCSCKALDICEHIVEAVIYYKLQHGSLNIEDLMVEENREIDMSFLNDLKNSLDELLIKGLTKLSLNELNRLELLAIGCETHRLYRLEKLFRSLRGNLELFLKKNTDFSRKYFRELILRAYSFISILKKSKDTLLISKALGKKRSRYFEVPSIELSALGAMGFMSKTGYGGITLYFYNKEKNKIMTLNMIKADYYENVRIDIGSMYKMKAPWNINTSIKNLSRARLMLYNPKINENLRISSSKEIKGDILRGYCIEELKGYNIYFNDFKKLKIYIDEKYSYRLFNEDENYNVVIIDAMRLLSSSFDEINQAFIIPALDEEKREIYIKIKFNKRNQAAIKNLELLEKKSIISKLFLAKVYREKEKYIAEPISFYYGDSKLLNITLD